MKTTPPEHAVFISSENPASPYYPNQRFELGAGLYCDKVIEDRSVLIVEDARRSREWSDNPDMEHGMLFYMGLPLVWPDGAIFGTICVLDIRRNPHAVKYEHLLSEFCEVINSDLRYLAELDMRVAAQRELNENLENLEKMVAERTRELEDANTALRVLLKNVEASKETIEEQVLRQIKVMVLPHVSKLRHLDAGRDLQISCLDMIETNLKSMTSSLSSRMAKTLEALTPAEMEIAQMIMLGRSTKEIARILSRGASTVNFHRNNIRRKLGLNDRRRNLRQYLVSLT